MEQNKIKSTTVRHHVAVEGKKKGGDGKTDHEKEKVKTLIHKHAVPSIIKQKKKMPL